MKPNSRFQRAIATFFLLIFFPTLVPQSLYASNNGPVAPEATSFEPVDATDIVNLATGDMTYVLPLLDVPSPEGGYPISLAYHAGIASDQDASWIGLGWNINPGAIDRSVNGFPDDWKEGKTSSIVYDSGGEITSHDFSIGVGWGEGKYSTGLYGSYSENKAFNGENQYNFDGGTYADLGIVEARAGSDGIGINLSYDYNYEGQVDPATNTKTKINSNVSIGIKHSFKSGGTSFTMSADAKMSKTGTETGSKAETKFNGSIGIGSTSYSGSSNGSFSGAYSTFQACDAFILNASIYILQINYSFSKIKYWYFDKKTDKGVGTLHAENIKNVRDNSLFEDQQGLDTYIASYDQSDESRLKGNIVLPAYDFYSVSAQGLSGNMSPKIFEYGTLTPKRENINLEGQTYLSRYFQKKNLSRDIEKNNIHFYFNNANESYLDNNTSAWDTSIPTTLSKPEDISNINSPTSNIISTVNIDGVNYSGYNSTNNRKKGASFIETFTNDQIINNPNLVYTPSNFNRQNPFIPKKGIGAFKITTIDGKTYHYTLPVYQKEKFSRYSQYDEDIKNKFFEEYQTDPYATHWLLTAVTGSDYVDNGDGKISNGDLGYWTVFDYGKWSDGYAWRTPRGNDFKTTPTSKTYEWGVKEIYYLNAIKTRTHTAYFIKSERDDSKSIPDSSDRTYDSIGVLINKCRKNINDERWYFNGIDFTSPGYSDSDAASLWILHKVRMNYSKLEHKLLKLDKIILLKNEDIPTSFNYSNPNEKASSLKCSINIDEYAHIYDRNEFTRFKKEGNIYSSNWSGEYYNNILDIGDINYYFPNADNSSSKIVELNQDYALAKGTPNSVTSTLGRLSLNKIIFKGKDGKQTMPPYQFFYQNPSNNYNINNIDDWGYNKNSVIDWSLNKIIYPNGANISINYEEDDFYTEAVNYETYLKDGLKFKFSEYSGKLRIQAYNVNPSNINKVNFSSLYEVNKKAKVNIWACRIHEYNDWGCKERQGKVNIENEYIDVVSVSPDNVVFETTLDHTYNNDGGLNGLYETEYSYDMFGIQRDRKRGECPDMSGGCSSRTRHTFYYNIFSNKTMIDANGGGLRVKEISINADNRNFKTNYYYNQNGYNKIKGGNNYKSSGITSYAPSKHNKNIKYLAELPPPSVFYNTVTVEKDQSIKKYYFKTFNPEVISNDVFNLGDVLKIEKKQTSNNVPITINNIYYETNSSLNKYKYEVENNFSMIGQLLKQETYNKNNQLLEKIENNYKSTSNIKQGKNKESFDAYSFVQYRIGDNSKLNSFVNLSTSSKTTYPSVLESVKTSGSGYTSTTNYNKYDFLTGQVLETTTETSDGKKIKSRTVPAYTISQYSKMGSKAEDPTNKNMLSQTAAEYSYIMDNGTWKETGVGITTWNNIWEYQDIEGNISSPTADNQKIWRKHRTYVWNGVKDPQGIFQNFNNTNDDDFNWTVGVGSQPSQWKLVSEVTKYDHYSMLLEAKDINNNHAATKMGDNDTKITAVGNAKYNELFYSGMETLNSNNWLEPSIKLNGTNTRNSSLVHTGRYSAATTNASNVTIDLKNPHKAGKYKLNVWVHKNNASKAKINFSGTIKVGEIKQAGDWVLKTYYLDIPATATQIQLTSTDATEVIYDDVMLRPIASSITGYVYNEWDELSYIVGNGGLATRFDYDSAGRLIKTYVEVFDDQNNGLTGGFKLTTENKQKYKYLQ